MRIELPIRLLTNLSVSYTHLDVYKRQTLCSTVESYLISNRLHSTTSVLTMVSNKHLPLFPLSLITSHKVKPLTGCKKIVAFVLNTSTYKHIIPVLIHSNSVILSESHFNISLASRGKFYSPGS